MMQIIQDFPPNYSDITAAFPFVKKVRNVIFTYGDVIYNPYGGKIPQQTIEHEQVHAKRQARMGKEQWWQQYLSDEKFRLAEELHAYRKEYKVLCRIEKDRVHRLKHVDFMATNLSSQLYGSLLSKEEAVRKITSFLSW